MANPWRPDSQKGAYVVPPLATTWRRDALGTLNLGKSLCCQETPLIPTCKRVDLFELNLIYCSLN